MFLRSASRSKFEAIVGSDMPLFFAILGLLFCLIATRADDPPGPRQERKSWSVWQGSFSAFWHSSALRRR